MNNEGTAFLDTGTVLIAFITFLLVWLAQKILYGQDITSGQRLPPILPGLPILGSILDMGDQRTQLETFYKAKEKYGPIFLVKMGPKNVLVLADGDSVREAFTKKEFDYRPPLYSFNYAVGGDDRGLIFVSGNVWKEHRKFSMSVMREFGMGKDLMEQKISEELEEFVREVNSDIKEHDNIVDVDRNINMGVVNIINAVVFGKRYDYKDSDFIKFLKILKENLTVVGEIFAVNSLPILRFLPFGPGTRFWRFVNTTRSIVDGFIRPHVVEHEENLDPNNAGDFLDYYLREMKTCEAEGRPTTFQLQRLVVTALDLFAAGSETTATSLAWALRYMVNYPEIQQRVRAELDRVVGARPVRMADRDQLPYTQATVNETERFASIVPASVPHSNLRPTTVGGYYVPADTIVLGVLQLVHFDRASWGDPDRFRPERFLDFSEQADQPRLVRKPDLMPFSVGGRSCLGELLAKMELFMFFATIMQRYEVRAPPGAPLPSLDPVYGITVTPRPYAFMLVAR